MSISIDLGGLVALCLAVIGLVVWLIRLEGRNNYQEDRLTKLEAKHENLDNKVVERLSSIEISVAKIEGLLSSIIKNKE